jgi:hypothetical protein
MKLLNFRLSKPAHSVVLIGLNCEWDLHNFAKFSGITLNAVLNELSVAWSVPNVSNPWGFPGNLARGCYLRFAGLESVRIEPRDVAMPLSEDVCLAGLSMVVAQHGPHRFRSHWNLDDPFNLLFAFQSGRTIEVASESAELVAI